MDGTPAPRLERRLLHRGGLLAVGHIVGLAVDERAFEVPGPGQHALALPLAGLFARHTRARAREVLTPSHGAFFPAGRDYRMSFPGGIGDEVLTVQWSDAALEATLPGARLPESHALLGPRALLARARLWQALARGPADALEVESLGAGLLSECLPALAPPRRVRAGGRARVEDVKAAVGASPERKWSLAELAAVARLSASQLACVFRDEVGVPVHAYVTRARLAKALPAVLEGGEGLTAIALDCGFASHSHFTARFRAHFGMAPAALRRRKSGGS